MKINRFAALAAFFAVTLSASPGLVRAGDRDSGRGYGRGGGRRITKLQSISMSRPERLDAGSVVNDKRQIDAPRQYENGEAVRERAVNIPPSRHSDVMGDRNVVQAISREQGAERVKGKYYWHSLGGRRYAHFYDDHGLDWYGFYFGSQFYWTRYYSSRWWWYDAGYTRWVFWWSGHWWWQGPDGTAYVYLNDTYYPYQEGGVTVQTSTTVPPAQASPAAETVKQWNSPDLSRLVKVIGAEDEAFLYDRSGGKQVFLAYLGKGADKVRFSGGVSGQPLQILVDFKDGTFALFDADGKSGQPQVPVSAPPLPDLPPTAVPGSTTAVTAN